MPGMEISTCPLAQASVNENILHEYKLQIFWLQFLKPLAQWWVLKNLSFQIWNTEKLIGNLDAKDVCKQDKIMTEP